MIQNLGKTNNTVLNFLKRKRDLKNGLLFSSIDSSHQHIALSNNINSIFDNEYFHCEVENHDFSRYNIISISSDNLTSIGDYALFGCAENLISVNCKNAISCGTQAFAYCYKLSSVEIPNITQIKYYCFQECFNLPSIDLLEISSIPEYCFSGCSSLTSINIPKVQYLKEYAFQNCSNLISLELPNIVEFGKAFNLDTPFVGCINLSAVYMPNALYIDNVFKDCTGLKKISCPNAKYVKEYALSYKSLLQDVDIRNALCICYDAFTVSKLSSIQCSSVTDIYSSAFDQCTMLTSVYLPCISSIGSSSFANCTNLKFIDFGNNMNNVPNILSDSFGLNSGSRKTTLSCYVPDYLYDDWCSSENWRLAVTYGRIEIIKRSNR